MAQAGRGGGGAKGGQGGAGSPGSGAGSTGGRDSAMGGGGSKSGGGGLGGFLDKVFGYDNIDQRRQAYSNNPNAAGKGYDGMIPSFPEAPLSYGLAALAGAPFGPVGWGGLIADVAMGGSGHGMFADAMAAQGMGPGPRGPDVPGGGKEKEGKGGALRDATLWNDVPTEAQQVTTPEQKVEDTQTQFRKRQYALGLNGVPAPLGYRYGTAKWL